MHPSSLLLQHHAPVSTTTTRRTSNAVAVPSLFLTSAPAYPPTASSVPGPGAPLPGPAPGSNRKKPSRPSKTKPGKHLFKSLSTPQLRGPIMSDPDDKKRNKLGYQRISIACAHCRRRKIRCLVSDDEREGRCQNCIRLKKECVFYPVDQQAAIDARSDSGKAGGPSAPSSTVSSSPNHTGARSFETPSHQLGGGGFTSLPPDSTGSYHSIPIAPNLTIPPQGQYSGPDSGYSAQSDTWSPRDLNSPNQALPVGPPGRMHPPSRYGQHGLAADTAPFPSPVNPPQQPYQQMEGYNYNPDQMWQPQQQHQPVRPMPFPEAYQNQGYNPSFPMNQGTPGSYSRPPPIHSPQPMQPPQGLPPGQHHPYMLSNDQRPPSMGMPPFPQHTIHSNWYSNAPSYGAGGGTPRTLPSNDPHNGFPGRPG